MFKITCVEEDISSSPLSPTAPSVKCIKLHLQTPGFPLFTLYNLNLYPHLSIDKISTSFRAKVVNKLRSKILLILHAFRGKTRTTTSCALFLLRGLTISHHLPVSLLTLSSYHTINRNNNTISHSSSPSSFSHTNSPLHQPNHDEPPQHPTAIWYLISPHHDFLSLRSPHQHQYKCATSPSQSSSITTTNLIGSSLWQYQRKQNYPTHNTL